MRLENTPFLLPEKKLLRSVFTSPVNRSARETFDWFDLALSTPRFAQPTKLDSTFKFIGYPFVEFAARGSHALIGLENLRWVDALFLPNAATGCGLSIDVAVGQRVFPTWLLEIVAFRYVSTCQTPQL